MNEKEWGRVSEGRLGYTLAGMGRFTLPLGTELQEETSRTVGYTKIGVEQERAIVISSQAGEPLTFKYLDVRWGRDFAKKLTAGELDYIDHGLTASYDETKKKWFAPLGLEWDAFVGVQAKIRQRSEIQALYRDFSVAAQTAMQAVWAKESQ